jgi:putative transposase
MMKARWTFRCYPTPEQAQHLARTFGCVRFVWNWALRLRSDGYRAGNRIGYPETDKRLTLLKRQPETAWLNEVSSVCLQQSLRDLQLSFSSFFDKRTGYPAFKRKDGAQSAAARRAASGAHTSSATLHGCTKRSPTAVPMRCTSSAPTWCGALMCSTSKTSICAGC